MPRSSDGNMRVLLVDDDSDTRDAFKVYLAARGHDVITAASGLQALNQALLGFPDVIVLDIALPELDGWEILRQLKSRIHTRKIPVIVLSGHTWPGDRIQASGCEMYLQKPCGPVEALQHLEQVLYGRP